MSFTLTSTMYGIYDLILVNRVWQRWWGNHFCDYSTLYGTASYSEARDSSAGFEEVSYHVVKGAWEDHVAGVCGSL